MKFATSELLRRKYSGRPLDVEEETTKVTRGKNTWPGKSYIIHTIVYNGWLT